jgi:integrase
MFLGKYKWKYKEIVVAFTKANIRALEWNGKPLHIVWDTKHGTGDAKKAVPHFGVRIQRTTRSYIVQYRELNRDGRANRNSVRRKVIGRCDTMTLDEARSEAQRLRLNGVSRDRRPSYNGTLAQFAPKYISIKADDGLRSLRDVERRFKKFLIPRFGKRRLVDITRPQVRQLHTDIKSGALTGRASGVEANRVLALLSNVFTLAELEGPHLFIEDTKTRKPHHALLSSQAIRILKQLSQLQGDSPFLFPSPVRVGHPRTDVKEAWETIREEAEIQGTTIHDLRRTSATWLTTLGYSEQVIRGILNHSLGNVTAVYARVESSTEQNAVNALGTRVEKLLGTLILRR